MRVKSLYMTMRALYEQIAPPGTFLISATRLGGQHGYDEAGAVAPLGGAVTASPRRTSGNGWMPGEGGRFRSRQRKPAEIAELLIEETLRDPGAVEIGYRTDCAGPSGSRSSPPPTADPA